MDKTNIKVLNTGIRWVSFLLAELVHACTLPEEIQTALTQAQGNLKTAQTMVNRVVSTDVCTEVQKAQKNDLLAQMVQASTLKNPRNISIINQEDSDSPTARLLHQKMIAHIDRLFELNKLKPVSGAASYCFDPLGAHLRPSNALGNPMDLAAYDLWPVLPNHDNDYQYEGRPEDAKPRSWLRYSHG